MHTQGNPLAPWTRGLKTAAGLFAGLTVVVILNLLVYWKVRQFVDPDGNAPQIDELLRLLVVMDLLALVGLSGFVLWLQRRLSAHAARELTDPIGPPAHDAQLRERLAEQVRIIQALQAENAERRRLDSQMKRFQKMESLGKLVGGVAHEFNNYLTVIVGFSEQLLQQLPQGSMEHLTILEILKAGERSAELTRGLLGLARVSDGNVRQLDINRQIEALRRMFGIVLGKRVRLEMALESGLPLIEAVPGQIEQVLLNLAANARDAMPQGGQLFVETHTVILEEPHDDLPPGRYALLSVKDTGTGISAETQRRMFEPFYTTKEQGTGLGLATVHEIVSGSHGAIVVESVLGQGTTFKVYWPATTASAERSNGNMAEDTQKMRQLEHDTMTYKLDF